MIVFVLYLTGLGQKIGKTDKDSPSLGRNFRKKEKLVLEGYLGNQSDTMQMTRQKQGCISLAFLFAATSEKYLRIDADCVCLLKVNCQFWD